MSSSDIVRKTMETLESGDVENAGSFLSDDFEITGPIPERMNKLQFLGLMKGLISAMPDFSFNPSEIKEEGGKVSMKIHVNGTHTGLLNLAAIGIPPLHATGVEVVLPEEPVTVTVKDGMIVSAKLNPVPGGGATGALEQLGIELSTRSGV